MPVPSGSSSGSAPRASADWWRPPSPGHAARQRRGERDAAAGHLRTGRVRTRERRGDGDAGAAPAAGGGGDHRGLLVRAGVDRDGLAGAEANGARDRDDGRAHLGRGAAVVAPGVPTVAMTAVSTFAPLSIVIV